MIGQFSSNGIGCKVPVKLNSRHWSYLVRFDPSNGLVKLNRAVRGPFVLFCLCCEQVVCTVQ